ncbi:outer membrane protein assembly factor BamD, partial [bacterium]
EALYADAQKAIADEDYDEAQNLASSIREEYPFSPVATDAELLSADVMYAREDYEEAAAAFRAFEENHPAHARVAYAIYRRGLSYHKLLESSDRDQTPTRMMVEVMARLARAYPESEYASDASQKAREGRNLLASHELGVAEYYVRKEKPDSARQRLEGLLKDFPDSDFAPEAQRLLSTLPAK